MGSAGGSPPPWYSLQLIVDDCLAGSDAIHLEPTGPPTAWTTCHGCAHASTGPCESMPSARVQLHSTPGQKGRRRLLGPAAGAQCPLCSATAASPTRTTP